MAANNTVPDHVWDQEVAYYELGLKHANQIARELGVSPQTVSRHMKRRGAVKGSRVQESIQELFYALDRKARAAALVDLTDSQRRRKVAEENMKSVGLMVEALFEANRLGDLSLAAPAINRVSAAIGPRRRRR